MSVKDKKDFVMDYMRNYNVKSENIADDVNDLEAIQLADCRGCPSDAIMKIRNVCNFVSNHPGGCGTVREFCDYIEEQLK